MRIKSKLIKIVAFITRKPTIVRGSISTIGGVYDDKGQHLIISYIPKLKDTLVIKIRERNNRIQINISRAYNSKKISNQFHGWITLKKISK